MSTTISISPVISKEDASVAFVGIINTIINNGINFNIVVERFLTVKEIKKLKIDKSCIQSIQSGNKWQVLLNVNLEDIFQKANSVIEGDEKIIAFLQINFYKEYWIHIDIQLYGKNYNNGHEVEDEGYIRMHFNYNDWIRPIKQVLTLKKKYTDEEIMHDEEYRVAVKLCNEIFEKIFLILALASKKINHCVGYLEAGVPLPIFSFSMLHKNPFDFILDYWRIYIGYFYDIKPSVLYGIYEAQAFIALLNKLRPTTRNDYYYQQLNSNYPDAIKFIESIKLDEIKLMSELSNNEIIQLIKDTKNFIENDILNTNIEVKNINNVFVVYGIPANNLWKFYETLYILAQQSLRAN